ncbi:MAG: hypothetical protein IJQ29_00395 [Synergistaceae bacterium]|nr:hypothetical protein [Synergistaceae bacterium]MBQ6908547.1 hypothetical protein [Synergistaceae bacterium]
MTGALQVFDFEEQAVRVVMQGGEPWWVARDICNVLDIQNTTQAVEKLDDDERAMFNIGRQGEANIISESGLYSLIIRSDKPEAKKFKRWVTHEVIPSIRKTGRYELKKAQMPRIGRGIISAAKEILKSAGIKGNQFTLALDKLYKHYTGESALALMEIELETPDTKQILTPTEIGKELNESARAVNKYLEAIGYQTKIADKWEATSAGETYAVLVDTGRRQSNGMPIKQLKWQNSIIEVLRNYLIEEDG